MAQPWLLRFQMTHSVTAIMSSFTKLIHHSPSKASERVTKSSSVTFMMTSSTQATSTKRMNPRRLPFA